MKKNILTSLISLACGSAFAISMPLSGAVSPAGPATIALSWDDVSGETGYYIYRDGSLVGTVGADETHFYDRGLTENTHYQYAVTAVDAGGESGPLNLGSVETTIHMNIIFIFADDMGPKDLVALRNPAIDGASIHETPAMDTLVQDGMVFRQCYASGPRCVVARRALMTGRYDWRADNYDSAASGLAPDVWTYADAVKLSPANYRTCYLGKYHLGESSEVPANGPKEQGFDVQIGSGHKGAPAKNSKNELSYFPNPDDGLYESLSDEVYNMGPGLGLNAPAESGGAEYLTDRLTDETIGFIADSLTNHASQPFFVSLAHYAVHTAIEAKQSDVDYFKAKKAGMLDELAAHPQAGSGLLVDLPTVQRRLQDNIVYAAMVKGYDDSLAQIRTYLAATDDPRNPGKKLSETTIIVISSDHGSKADSGSWSSNELDDDNDLVDNYTRYIADPQNFVTEKNFQSHPASNYPFRHGKTWVYEGGIKIPLIVYYPGVTPSGGISDALVHGADFFATFADMTGAPQQPSEAVDSVSFMLPAAQPPAKARKESFHWFTNASTGTANFCLGAYRKGDWKLLYFGVQRKVELYNLAADPYERNDLSEKRPDIADEMLAKLYEHIVSTDNKLPTPSDSSVLGDKSRGTWSTEQEILVRSGMLSSLPAAPDAAPTWGAPAVTQLSPTSVQLSWTVNASNADYSVILRKDQDGPNVQTHEIAYIPVQPGVVNYTFIDRNLVEGYTYDYIIESENLGGWVGWEHDETGRYSGGTVIDGVSNSGKHSITLAEGMAPLPLTAGDDPITAVPGELRVFDPLVNDRGEGPLKITGISGVNSNSIWTDGSLIYYQVPEGFNGGVSLSYTVMDSALQTNSANVQIGWPITPSSTRDLGTWQFDEAAGTHIENTVSSSGISFSGTTASSVAANGLGQLVVGPDTADYTLSSDLFPGGPFTEGLVRMEYHLKTAQLSNNNGRFGFELADSGGAVRFKLLARNVNGDIHIEVDNGTRNSLHNFGTTIISNVIIAAVADQDAGTVATEYSVDNGSTFISLAGLVMGAGGDLGKVKFSAKNSKLASGDAGVIETFTVTRIDAELSTSAYSLWSESFEWNGVLARGPSDDPDGDGLLNLTEFALGTSPVEFQQENPVSVVPTSPAPSVQFTPQRDASLIEYRMNYSTNLLAGWTSTELITSEPGMLVERMLPIGYEGFGQLLISE